MFLVVCWLRAPIQYDQRARQEDLPELIDFGTCSLHAVDGALRAGSSNDGEVMEFLKHSYAVFKNIPSRPATVRHWRQGRIASLKFWTMVLNYVEKYPSFY